MLAQAKRPQAKAAPPPAPAKLPLKPATEPAMPMPSLFTGGTSLERPSQKKQKKACPACAAGGATCPKCQAKKPTLERPASDAQMRRGSPGEDPAERQADDLGKRIGDDLTGTESVGHGPLPKSVRDVAESHLGVSLEGTHIDAGSGGQRKAKDESALAVTEGKQVAFGAGQLSTSTAEGRALLGHELVHVGQQLPARRPSPQRKEAPKSGATSALTEIRELVQRSRTGALSGDDAVELNALWTRMDDLPSAASKNLGLWEESVSAVPLLAALARPTQQRFASDVSAEALARLATSEKVARAEMAKFGVGPGADITRAQPPPAPTAYSAESKKIAEAAHGALGGAVTGAPPAVEDLRTKAQAARVLQSGLDRMLKIQLGWDAAKAPIAGSEKVYFDPDVPPSPQRLDGALLQWSNLKPVWDDGQRKLQEIGASSPALFSAINDRSFLTNAASPTLLVNPKRRLDVFADQTDTEQTLAHVRAELQILLSRIARSKTLVSRGGTDTLRALKAVHQSLLTGSGGASGTDWTRGFEHWAGRKWAAPSASLGPEAQFVVNLIDDFASLGIASVLKTASARDAAKRSTQKLQSLAQAAATPGTELAFRSQLSAAEATLSAKEFELGLQAAMLIASLVPEAGKLGAEALSGATKLLSQARIARLSARLTRLTANAEEGALTAEARAIAARAQSALAKEDVLGAASAIDTLEASLFGKSALSDSEQDFLSSIAKKTNLTESEARREFAIATRYGARKLDDPEYAVEFGIPGHPHSFRLTKSGRLCRFSNGSFCRALSPEELQELLGAGGMTVYGPREVSYEVGLSGASELNAQHGFESVYSNPFESHGRFGQGFDDIGLDSDGNLVLVEYKGGTAADDLTAKKFESRLQRLEDGDEHAQALARVIRKAEREGKLMCTTTEEIGNSGKMKIVKYIPCKDL